LVLIGNPDEVTRKVEELQRGGVTQTIGVKQKGHVPHANVMCSIKRMAQYVFPHFNPHRTITTEESRAAAL